MLEKIVIDSLLNIELILPLGHCISLSLIAAMRCKYLFQLISPIGIF